MEELTKYQAYKAVFNIRKEFLDMCLDIPEIEDKELFSYIKNKVNLEALSKEIENINIYIVVNQDIQLAEISVLLYHLQSDIMEELNEKRFNESSIWDNLWKIDRELEFIHNWFFSKRYNVPIWATDEICTDSDGVFILDNQGECIEKFDFNVK